MLSVAMFCFILLLFVLLHFAWICCALCDASLRFAFFCSFSPCLDVLALLCLPRPPGGDLELHRVFVRDLNHQLHHGKHALGHLRDG